MFEIDLFWYLTELLWYLTELLWYLTVCKQKKTILILNWFVWSFTRPEITRKGLMCRKTKQPIDLIFYSSIYSYLVCWWISVCMSVTEINFRNIYIYIYIYIYKSGEFTLFRSIDIFICLFVSLFICLSGLKNLNSKHLYSTKKFTWCHIRSVMKSLDKYILH